MKSLLRKGAVWLGLLCLLFAFLGCGGPEKRKKQFYDKGNAFYQKGEYRNARLELKNAVQIDPEFVDGYYLLGQVEIKDKKINQAVKYFKRVLKLSPDRIDARLMLAHLGLLAKDFDYALKMVKEVLAIQPDNLQAHIAEGYIFLNTGNKKSARDITENLLAQGHNDPDLYMILAATYSRTKEKKKREDIYKRGIRENNDSPPLFRALIDLYVSENRIDEAVELLSRLVEMEPDQVMHRFRLAQLYWNQGNQGDAEKILEHIVEIESKNEVTIVLLANFYATHRQYASAEKILEEALKGKPESIRYRLAISDLYVAQGKLRDAERILEQFSGLIEGKNDSKTLKIRNTLARIYLAAGDIDKAMEQIEKVIAVNKNDMEAHYTKGEIFLIRGEGDKAVTEFRLLTTEDPHFIEGHLGLAEAHILNRSYELAIDDLGAALEQNARSKKILQSLASVYMLKNEKVSAEIQLRKILEFYPEDVQTHLYLGDLFYAQKDWAAAEVEYNKSMVLAPGSQVPYLRLSRLFRRDGRKKAAVAVLETAQGAGISSPSLFAALVQLYLKGEQFDKAVATCVLQQQNDPDNAFYYYLLGQVYASMKIYDLAEEQFNKAIELAPSWLAPQKEIAGLYSMQGRTGAAISKLEDVLAKKSENQWDYIILALLYEQEENYQKAIHTYERALAAHPENWIAANNLAHTLMEHHTDKISMKKALTLAEKARHLRPQSTEIADTLSWAYFKNENYTRALMIIQQAVPVSSEDPGILFHRGAILYKNGKIAEAKESLEKALAGNEKFYDREHAVSLLENIVALIE